MKDSACRRNLLILCSSQIFNLSCLGITIAVTVWCQQWANWDLGGACTVIFFYKAKSFTSRFLEILHRCGKMFFFLKDQIQRMDFCLGCVQARISIGFSLRHTVLQQELQKLKRTLPKFQMRLTEPFEKKTSQHLRSTKYIPQFCIVK